MCTLLSILSHPYLCLPCPLVYFALLDDAVELEAAILRDGREGVERRQLLIPERTRLGGRKRQTIRRDGISRGRGEIHARGGNASRLRGRRDVGHGVGGA